MKNKYILCFFLTLLISTVLIYSLGCIRPMPISSLVLKEKFWADKVHSDKKYDVIVAGDSRVYRGVDPESINKELKGLDVLNFGFSSGGFNELIFEEIEKRLKRDSKNKVIVLGLTPYSLTPKAQNNSHFLQEKNRNNQEVFNKRFLNPLFSFFNPIKPSDFLQNNDIIKGYHEKFRKDGWVESKKIPFNPKSALQVYVKDFKDNLVSKEVLDNLFKQIKQWVEKDIIVFAIRIPTTRDMEGLENEISGYREETIKKDIESHGAHWIDIKNRFDYFSYDGSHLEGESARQFSSYIGKEIYYEINKK